MSGLCTLTATKVSSSSLQCFEHLHHQSWPFLSTFLASFFEWFLKASGSILGAILGYFLGANFTYIFDFAKKGAHHGFIAHGGEIKGPAAEQASKKAANIEKGTSKNKLGQTMIFYQCWLHFGSLLGAKRPSKFEWNFGSDFGRSWG